MKTFLRVIAVLIFVFILASWYFWSMGFYWVDMDEPVKIWLHLSSHVMILLGGCLILGYVEGL